MKMISLASAAILLSGMATLVVAQTTTATSPTASFGTDVSGVAQSHENTTTDHGIGATVSDKAHARNAARTHASDGSVDKSTDATDVSERASVGTRSNDRSARAAAEVVSAAHASNSQIADQKGAVAELRSAVRSDVAQTRSDVASTHADVSATVSDAKAIRAAVAAARPGH
jgi:hypothetical protein